MYLQREYAYAERITDVKPMDKIVVYGIIAFILFIIWMFYILTRNRGQYE